MSSPNRPARLNRTLLAFIGLLLLLLGAFGLVFGLGLLTDRLPRLDRTAPLVPSGAQVPGWVPWVGAAAAIVVALLMLRWLTAQALRRPKTGTWHLRGDASRGTTRLAADTAADALIADIQRYPEVNKATATISGPAARPTLHLAVTTHADTRIGALREQISTHALPRLQQALELDDLPAELVLAIGREPARTIR